MSARGARTHRQAGCPLVAALAFLLIAFAPGSVGRVAAAGARAAAAFPVVSERPSYRGWAALHRREALRGRRCDREFRCHEWPGAAEHRPLLDRFVTEQAAADGAFARRAARLRGAADTPVDAERDFAALHALTAADEARWRELEGAYRRQWLAHDDELPALPGVVRIGVLGATGLLLALALGALRRMTRQRIG